MKYPAKAYRMEWKAIILSLVSMSLPIIANGQATVTLSPIPHVQFLSNAGIPLASGCVNTYIAGTTTPQTTYRDSGGVNTNTNPIILNAGGFADIWLDVTKSYKFTVVSAGGVNCSTGVTQWTVDNITVPSINALLSSNNTWSGNQTINGSLIANGSATVNTLSANGAVLLNSTLGVTGAATLANVNSMVQWDGVKYPFTSAGLTQAVTDCTANAACSGVNGIGASGVITLTANPFSSVPGTQSFLFVTDDVTLTWDSSIFSVTIPPNFHWVGTGTTLQRLNPNNATLSVGFIGGQSVATTGSITNGSTTLTVASAPAAFFTQRATIGIIGAKPASTLQADTLNGAMTNNQTTIVVNSASGWASTTNYFQIDSEMIVCTSLSANTFSGCTRGYGGTTPATHSNGAAVNSIFYFVTEIVSVSGTTITLLDAATQTVTNGVVTVGIHDSSIEGTMTFDGQQNQAQPSNGNCGFAADFASRIFIDSNITFQNWEQCGLSFRAGRHHNINGNFVNNGKNSSHTGFDINLSNQSSYNTIRTNYHRSSQVALLADDRTTTSTPVDGPDLYNVAYLGNITADQYGIDLEGGNFNTFYSGTVATTGLTGSYAVLCVGTQWRTQPVPTGNIFYFGSLDGGALGNALNATGYTLGYNSFIGGKVQAGSVTTQLGDTLITVDKTRIGGGSGATNLNYIFSSQTPRVYWEVPVGGHANWRISAQDNVNNGWEVDSGTSGTDASAATYTRQFSCLSTGCEFTKPFDVVENSGTPAGLASASVIGGSSDDHFLYQNLNNAGAQPVPQRGILTSTYTNATTTASNITGLSFSVAASRNYVMSCHLYYQGSATTAGLDITITGPASPTSVFYAYEEHNAATTITDSVASAFSTKLVGGTITATTNFSALVTMGLRNGANAGTIQVQGSATGAGTVTVQAGSFCTIQ